MPMAELTCQIVRPDRLLYEDVVDHVVLVAYTGEVGVWPDHASEILALGDGVMRVTQRGSEGGGVIKIAISGGYAEIANNKVIVLADNAARLDEVDVAEVNAQRKQAVSDRDALSEDDHRRAYYENKIAWCDLLLGQVNKEH